MLARLPALFLTCVASFAFSQESTEFANSIGMKFVAVPAGNFQMGSPMTEEGAHADEVQHEVTLTKSFHIGVTEVTQGQYLKVMGKNPSNSRPGNVRSTDTSNFPVDSVSWNDAVNFCQKLSELPEEKAAGRAYRLPTEAEWEYACRAGTTGPYASVEEADELHHFAWIKPNSEKSSHPVASRKPNPWGLFDMHGNVWEWCHDFYQSPHASAPATDPHGPKTGTEHVVRGGSFLSPANHCRSASRRGRSGNEVAVDCGFRVVLISTPSK